MFNFRSDYFNPQSTPCSAGDPFSPIFEYDENGELVDTGKKRNLDAEIQSHKDEVLLSKIVERCGLTGETLLAPAECFGDATQLPKDILDAHNKQRQVQSFVDSLSDDQLKVLNEQGFDALVLSILNKNKAKVTPQQSEVNNE